MGLSRPSQGMITGCFTPHYIGSQTTQIFMNPLNLLTDAYDRQARLYPALLLISPAVVTGVAIFSAKLTVLQSCGSAVVGFGGAFLLTQLARDAGKSREPLLYKIWGGMPSILILRHSHARYDSITKNRYHKQLSALVKGTKSPTSAEEEADQRAADQIYTAWSHFLRVNARENQKKYPHVFKENINYGYRRNVWGLRPYGIVVSAVCILVAGTLLWFNYKHTGIFTEEVFGALAVSLLFLCLWFFRFTSDWVRVPADAYAERLVETLENMGGKSPVEKKKQ